MLEDSRDRLKEAKIDWIALSQTLQRKGNHTNSIKERVFGQICQIKLFQTIRMSLTLSKKDTRKTQSYCLNRGGKSRQPDQWTVTVLEIQAVVIRGIVLDSNIWVQSGTQAAHSPQLHKRSEGFDQTWK